MHAFTFQIHVRHLEWQVLPSLLPTLVSIFSSGFALARFMPCLRLNSMFAISRVRTRNLDAQVLQKLDSDVLFQIKQGPRGMLWSYCMNVLVLSYFQTTRWTYPMHICCIWTTGLNPKTVWLLWYMPRFRSSHRDIWNQWIGEARYSISPCWCRP